MKSFNPAVSKPWLLLIAGLMWSAVGLMLCFMALGWLENMHSAWALWIGLSALALALAVYRFGFVHIAEKNIRRLQAFLTKVCVFAFMPWKSYLLVAGMMSLGIALRSSALPRGYLAEIYITIGAALFLSSLHYYPQVWTALRSEMSE